jgi:hypothetical protein
LSGILNASKRRIMLAFMGDLRGSRRKRLLLGLIQRYEGVKG